MNLPHNSKDPKIVLGYDNQIKLMVQQTNNELWSKEDFIQLEKCKIEYLEKKLGYTIIKLKDVISHDDYETKLEKSTNFYKKEEEKNLDSYNNQLKVTNELYYKTMNGVSKSNENLKTILNEIKNSIKKRTQGVYKKGYGPEGEEYGDCQDCDLWKEIKSILNKSEDSN